MTEFAIRLPFQRLDLVGYVSANIPTKAAALGNEQRNESNRSTIVVLSGAMVSKRPTGNERVLIAQLNVQRYRRTYGLTARAVVQEPAEKAEAEPGTARAVGEIGEVTGAVEPSPLERSRGFLLKAKEYRRIAEISRSKLVCAKFRRLAAEYERLARDADAFSARAWSSTGRGVR